MHNFHLKIGNKHNLFCETTAMKIMLGLFIFFCFITDNTFFTLVHYIPS